MSSDESLLFTVDPGTHSATITELLVAGDGQSIVTVGMDKRVRWWESDEHDIEPNPVTLLGRIGPGADGAITAAALHRADGIVITAANSALTGGSVLRFRVSWLEGWQRSYRWNGTVADLAMTTDDNFLVVTSTGPRSDASDRSQPGVPASHEKGPRIEVFRFDDLVPHDSGNDSGTDDESGEPEGPVLATEPMAPPQPLYGMPLVIGPAGLGVRQGVDGNHRIVVTPTFVGRPQLFELSEDGLIETNAESGDDGQRLPAVGRRASVALSEDHVAIAGEDTGLTILAADGRVVVPSVPGAGGGAPVGVAFSSDGRLLVVGSRAGAGSEITIHDAADDFSVVGSRRYDDNAVAVGFRYDGRVVSAGGSRFSIHTWDPWTTGPQPDDWFVDGVGQVIDAIGVGGTQIAFGNPDPVRPNEPRGDVPTLARRFDLDLLALVPGAEESDQELELDEFQRAVHRLPGGAELERDQGQVFLEPAGVELADGPGFSTDQASSFGFVADDDQVIIGRRSGAVTVFRPPESAFGPGADIGRVLPERRLVGHVSAVLDVAVGDRWLVTAGRDQVIRLWPRFLVSDPGDGAADGSEDRLRIEPALSLFVTGTNEWVMWSRSGYYASSQNGDRYISYHHNRGEGQPALAYSGDQFVKNLYRPDVIRNILKSGTEAAALDEIGLEPLPAEASLPPEVRLIDYNTSFDSGESGICELMFDVTDAARPTTKVVVLQDGIPAFEIDVSDQPGEPVGDDGRVRRYRETIFLEPGDNRLSIIAENEVARSIMIEQTVSLPVPMAEEWFPPPPQSQAQFQESKDLIPTAAGMAGPIAEVLTAEAIVAGPEVVEENLTRGRVTGAELKIDLQAIEGDETLTITATRNQDMVWQADTGAGAAFDGHLTVQLQHGYNHIEVTAESADTHGVLFSAHLDVSPRYTIEPDDYGTGDGGQAKEPEVHKPDPDPEGDRRHLVVEGESLRLLAKRYYGHESRYPLIFEANPDLADLDRVLPGIELIIPVLEASPDDDGSTDEVDLAGWQAGQTAATGPRREPLGGIAGAGPLSNRPLEDPAGGSSESPSDSPPEGSTGTQISTGDVLSSDPLVVVDDNDLDPAMGGSRKGTGGNPRDLPPASDSGVPNLYMLSIGVSNLASRNEGFSDLSWPGDDAAAVAKRFSNCQGEQFGQVHQIGLGPRSVIEGTHATKENIEQAVEDLAAAVKARAEQKRKDKVGTTDVTVVFFSGHGMSRVAAEGEQEGLFLIPHDYDQERWQETSVSLLGIAETLCTLPKTELIIFIDACRSGFAGTDFAKRIKPEQFGKRVEAISPRTIYVLSSTARDLDSWEFGLKYPYDPSAKNRSYVGHGLFTHAILKRMDEADKVNSGLSILELGAAIHRQFETWRSWKAFSDIKVRQDPWYQFHRTVRHFELYKKSG